MEKLAKELKEKAEAAVAVKKRKLAEGGAAAGAVEKTGEDGESKAEDATMGVAVGGAKSSNGKGGGKGTKGSAPASAGKGGGAPSAKGKMGKIEKLSQEKLDQLGAEIGEQQRKALLAEQGQPPTGIH